MILLSKQIIYPDCACCGSSWNSKKDISYKDLGSKSRSFISSYLLLSKFGKQRVRLWFCNFCGNNLQSYTKVTNKGVLKIRNMSTGMWRNATSIGAIQL